MAEGSLHPPQRPGPYVGPQTGAPSDFLVRWGSCLLSYPSYLPCLLIGVLSSSRRWCQTWAGEWMHVAILSGYPLRAVLCATHSAIVRGLSTASR